MMGTKYEKGHLQRGKGLSWGTLPAEGTHFATAETERLGRNFDDEVISPIFGGQKCQQERTILGRSA